MGSKNVEERKEKAESRRGTIDLSSLLNRDVSFFLRKRNRKKKTGKKAQKKSNKAKKKKDNKTKIELQKNEEKTWGKQNAIEEIRNQRRGGKSAKLALILGLKDYQ